MNKKYRLKAYDKVSFHHFIDKEKWNELANAPELKVEFLDGFLGETVLISPKGEARTFANTFMVDKNDLYVVKEKVNPTPVATEEKKDKSYTKDELYRTGALVLKDIEDEDEAISTSIILAKFLNKLN